MSRRPASSAPHGRTGRPPVTSRTQILEAARRLIDRDGWEKLTIRRLAAEMGIGATTLYHHIRNKDDLLVLLLNHHIGQLGRPQLPSDPRERIVAAATAMHDALTAWPWAAEVLSADGFVGLLDESAMWMVEAIVSGADDYGCTPEQTVDVFRSIWYYTVGEVLVRAHSARRRTDGEPFAYRDDLDASQVPHLAAIGVRWAALAARDIYPQGLRTFVDALLAQAASETPRGVG
ncbi:MULTISPECIES: TetR/AcrR family transcriptional regulator [unclassified Streptomyces]|uniref:TetR/AcrR family transcriptional regulator n=1 Tax=unclassified Streptomyces TaxID=2593676 RepID=UPI002DD9A565|nr:TetR/AcrR family transcriptional regulator [Streptomyces sp. NBC_01795]WSA94100.1 TetR/AcrR family transcriptional regulator [Streptomyces sp. NBC_01795]WSS42062.1 TetR/AcrR family transcriptional regulator [Streptomyces sp. NBC_01187]